MARDLSLKSEAEVPDLMLENFKEVLNTAEGNRVKQHKNVDFVFNRPSLVRAVLQTALISKSVTYSLMLFLHNL